MNFDVYSYLYKFFVNEELIIICSFFITIFFISSILRKQIWFLNLKIYGCLNKCLKDLFEKNMIFFIVLVFVTIFLCYLCLLIIYEYLIFNKFMENFLILMIMMPKFFDYLYLNFLSFFFVLNIIVFVWVCILFSNQKNYFLIFFLCYNLILLIISIFIIFNLFNLDLLELVCYVINYSNKKNKIFNNVNFNNLKKIFSNEILDKDLYNKTIISNLVVQSNNQGEFGVCYKFFINRKFIYYLYNNKSYIIRNLCENGLHLFGQGELIINEKKNELMYCFFAKKK